MRKRTAFFGLLSWYEIVRTEVIGTDIYIHTDKPIRKVYLNGQEIEVNHS